MGIYDGTTDIFGVGVPNIVLPSLINAGTSLVAGLFQPDISAYNQGQLNIGEGQLALGQQTESDRVAAQTAALANAKDIASIYAGGQIGAAKTYAGAQVAAANIAADTNRKSIREQLASNLGSQATQRAGLLENAGNVRAQAAQNTGKSAAETFSELVRSLQTPLLARR